MRPHVFEKHPLPEFGLLLPGHWPNWTCPLNLSPNGTHLSPVCSGMIELGVPWIPFGQYWSNVHNWPPSDEQNSTAECHDEPDFDASLASYLFIFIRKRSFYVNI